MNIDELTIKEARELVELFGGLTKRAPSSFAGDLIGKYVLVRSINEGINAGYLLDLSADHVTITEARRIWYHKPLDKSMSWYEGVAVSGLSDDSSISVATPTKVIVEDYSITPCTAAAAENIQGFKAHAQT